MLSKPVWAHRPARHTERGSQRWPELLQHPTNSYPRGLQLSIRKVFKMHKAITIQQVPSEQGDETIALVIQHGLYPVNSVTQAVRSSSRFSRVQKAHAAPDFITQLCSAATWAPQPFPRSGSQQRSLSQGYSAHSPRVSALLQASPADSRDVTRGGQSAPGRSSEPLLPRRLPFPACHRRGAPKNFPLVPNLLAISCKTTLAIRSVTGTKPTPACRVTPGLGESTQHVQLAAAGRLCCSRVSSG